MTDHKATFVISVLNALIAAAIPALVALNLYDRGSVAEKGVTIIRSVIDPLTDLSRVIAKGNSIKLLYGESPLVNLRIEKTLITNTGKSTILASEFFTGFEVKVHTPWELLTVDTESSKVKVAWEKQSSTEWTMKPLLLNEGETIELTVYYTSKQAASPGASNDAATTWDARVAGLKKIKVEETYDIPKNLYGRSERGFIDQLLDAIAVIHTGVAVFALLLLFFALSFAQISLVQSVGIPLFGMRPSVRATCVVVAVALCASESITTYAFSVIPNNTIWKDAGFFGGVTRGWIFHLVNLAPIILSGAILWTSLRRAKSSS